MSTKTLLQGDLRGNLETTELAADTNVSAAVYRDGSDEFAAIASDDSDHRLLLLTSEGHFDKNANDTYGDADGKIDSGDSAQAVRPRKGDKVSVWLDNSNVSGNNVSKGDALYYYGSSGTAGTFSGAGSNNPILEAAEAIDNNDGDAVTRIEAYVL